MTGMSPKFEPGCTERTIRRAVAMALARKTTETTVFHIMAGLALFSVRIS